MLWDSGSWVPEVSDVGAALRKSELKFTLNGRKLNWVLIRIKGDLDGSRKPQWLLIQHRDKYASAEDVLEKKPGSVTSGRLPVDMARDSNSAVGKAATDDPAGSRAT